MNKGKGLVQAAGIPVLLESGQAQWDDIDRIC